jgi:hypothetical protein
MNSLTIFRLQVLFVYTGEILSLVFPDSRVRKLDGINYQLLNQGTDSDSSHSRQREIDKEDRSID